MRLFYKFLMAVTISVIVIGAFVDTPGAAESSASPLQSLFMMKQLIPQTQTVGLIWNQNKTNTNEIIPKIERASASIGVKVVIEDVEEPRDIMQKFRDLNDKYHVQEIWILANMDPIASDMGKDFLIKNSLVSGIALFAPSVDWVSAGACAALLSDGSSVKLYVNKKAISVLGIKIPDKYLQDTQFIAQN